MRRAILFSTVGLSLILANTGCKKHEQFHDHTGDPQYEKKWVVSTIAGDGSALFADGPALQAKFRAPQDVAVSEDGSIYVADAINHRIRKIMNGVVSTFAGSYNADTTSGSPYVTRFLLPIRVAIDNDGAVFTLDVNDPRLRKLSANGFSSVAAGDGTIGFEDGNGANAKFGNQCSGVVSDEQGNIYVVDWKNRRIRKINSVGQVTTVAGNGQAGFVDGAAASAQFFNPSGIAIDIQGNLFVGDGTCIRKITPGGIVSTFAGKDSVGYRDGLFNEALFSSINDLAVNHEGIIYLTDGDRIRKITPQGMVSTLAGSNGGFADGDAASAKFLGPVGLDIDKEGNIYVADDHNNRIRKISFE